MKPVKFEHIFEVANGLTQTIQLDAEAPHNFVCCHPCDADGNAVAATAGTVVYEVATFSAPYWVDIESNGDWSAPKDSAFQAPADQLKVTVSAPDGAVTHFRVAGVQYRA